MTIKTVFTNSLKDCNYVFLNGKVAHFINGVYLTDIESEIKELENEIKAFHPHIGQDSDISKRTVDTTNIDPLAGIKAAAIEEYLKSKASSEDSVTQLKTISEVDCNKETKDMGSTASIDQLKNRLNFGNSSTVAGATSGSSSSKSNS